MRNARVPIREASCSEKGAAVVDIESNLAARPRMESFRLFSRMHGDPQPVDCAVASWTAPVLWRFWPASIAKAPKNPEKTWRSLRRFLESPHALDGVRWDDEPEFGAQLVWCPAFRRSGAAKAGTPNRRFMKRRQSSLTVTTAYRNNAEHWVTS